MISTDKNLKTQNKSGTRGAFKTLLRDGQMQLLAFVYYPSQGEGRSAKED